MRNLVDAYERVASIAGIPDAEDGVTLAPLSHMHMNTNICVTIDGSGNFLRATKDKKDKKDKKDAFVTIIIPCTENSAVRTSGVCAHPLHDQLGYLALDAKKRGKYLEQIAQWSARNAKVAAVRKYVEGNTIIDDLERSGIKVKAKDDEGFVRFRVEIPGDLKPDLWLDQAVINAWRSFYEKMITESKYCYVTGKLSPLATKHPKGINPATNGAKLISCNDETGYTYRGRFAKAEQANAISYEASRKAHAMLRYIIEKQGRRCGTQAIVAWAIDRDENIELANPFDDSLDLYGKATRTEKDKLIEAAGKLDTDYALKLRSALLSYGGEVRLREHEEKVAVIAVDAATTGRMGITFYQELSKNEYIERIADWHEACRWHFLFDARKDGKDARKDGKDAREGGKKGKCACISAPGADDIIAAVFGKPTGESYAKLKKQARERILHCIFCGEPISRDWVKSAVHRASSPFSYAIKDGGWDKAEWEKAVAVACAMTRAYYNKKGEKLALENATEYADRSSLYGRLLAIANKIESHARHLQTGKDDTEKRPTNAVRYMQRFANRPFTTWNQLNGLLEPYKLRLDGAEGYQNQIDDIMHQFKPDEYASDAPLDGRYLMGYSLQRREFMRKKDDDKTEVNENADQEN